MHHRLVGLLLEVRQPAVFEVRRRPGFELLELFIRRPDLDAGVDAVRGQWASPLQLPLIENLWLQVSLNSPERKEGCGPLDW